MMDSISIMFQIVEILPRLVILPISKILRKLVFLVLIGLLLAPTVHAQSSKDSLQQKNNAISLLPQYAMIRGIRLDYERRLASGDLWLLIAPQLYLNTNEYYTGYPESIWTNYSSLRGIGANLYLKWNFNKSEKLDRISGLPSRLLYIAGGPSFQYYEFEGYDEVLVSYEENGMTLYKFEYQEVLSKIQRYGGNVNLGMQFAMHPFFVDIYLGFVYKISLDEKGEKIEVDYAEFLDPFYSGLYLDGGFKLGVYF